MTKTSLNPSRQKKQRTQGRAALNNKHMTEVTRSDYWWPITNAKIQQAAQGIVDSVHPEKIILFRSKISPVSCLSNGNYSAKLCLKPTSKNWTQNRTVTKIFLL